MTELNSLIRELKLILYGDDDSEPSTEACAQLTLEFFREDTLRLLIIFLPKLNLEVSFQTLLSYIYVVRLCDIGFIGDYRRVKMLRKSL